MNWYRRIALGLLTAALVCATGCGGSSLVLRLTLQVAPQVLQFVGGEVTVTATTNVGDIRPVTVTGSYDNGPFALTAVGNGTYIAKITLPGNPNGTAQTYTFSVSADDRVTTATQTATVSVNGPSVPGGGNGGQPPTPNIR